MSVLAMSRLSICAMKNDKDALIDDLQKFGMVEIDTSAFEDETLEHFNTHEETIVLSKKQNTLENAITILNEKSPEKKGIFSSLEGKPTISKKEIDEILSREEDVISLANKIIDLNKEIIDNKVAIDRNNVAIASLTPWNDLDIPLEFTETKRSAFIIGTVTKATNIDEVYKAISESLGDTSRVEVTVVFQNKYQMGIVAVSLKEDEALVEKGLHKIGFTKVSNAFSGIPKEAIEKLGDENIKLANYSEKHTEEIKSLAARKSELEILVDHYQLMLDKAEAFAQLPQSKSTFFITGYLPKKNADTIATKLQSKYQLFINMEEPTDKEDVPVVLNNKGIGGSVESIVASYGLPKKREIDPSNIMGFFYVLLFGMMLSDAAYGFIVMVTCFALTHKFKKMDPNLMKSLKMFMYCGVSTLFWGILFGGYFGDALNVITRTFMGHEVGIKPLWFAPLDDPMKLLMFCMLVGIIHLFLGLGIKGYMYIRDKKYINLFSEVICWYCLLIGLIMMLLPTKLFYSLSQIEMNFPPFMNTVAMVLAIGGAVGILLMAGHGRKNVGVRLALGAYDLYGMTSWLSDLLSYSRLLALGVATGVIASVLNQIGSMGGNSVGGIIIFVLVFIFGHIFNMAINMLGAYVHTCRLQYIEFFGKFYEGGGRVFNPFKSNTKYVDLGEEIE